MLTVLENSKLVIAKQIRFSNFAIPIYEVRWKLVHECCWELHSLSKSKRMFKRDVTAKIKVAPFLTADGVILYNGHGNISPTLSPPHRRGIATHVLHKVSRAQKLRPGQNVNPFSRFCRAQARVGGLLDRQTHHATGSSIAIGRIE